MDKKRVVAKRLLRLAKGLSAGIYDDDFTGYEVERIKDAIESARSKEGGLKSMTDAVDRAWDKRDWRKLTRLGVFTSSQQRQLEDADRRSERGEESEDLDDLMEWAGEKVFATVVSLMDRSDDAGLEAEAIENAWGRVDRRELERMEVI